MFDVRGETIIIQMDIEKQYNHSHGCILIDLTQQSVTNGQIPPPHS